MFNLVQIISISISVIMLIVVLELIRRNQLKERYSLIWLATGFVMIVLSVWRSLLDNIANNIGIYYPPSLLFLIAIVFLIVLLLNHSVVVSTLTKNNKRLAQEIGILKEKLRNIEKAISSNSENTNKEHMN